MLHDFLMTICHFFIGKALLNPVWNYGKKLVQAVALYWLVVCFVAFFVANYVSQPRPIATTS